MADFEEVMRPHLDGALEAGETLEGICAVAQQSTFRGRSLALGVTDRRLLLVPLDRKGRLGEEVVAIPPERVASAQAQGAGGGWVEVGPAILDSAAITLKLRTTDGQTYRLSMMRGTGLFGRLGGGESQREGIEALGRGFERFASTG
jgi:hypothetical protein